MEFNKARFNKEHKKKELEHSSIYLFLRKLRNMRQRNWDSDFQLDYYFLSRSTKRPIYYPLRLWLVDRKGWRSTKYYYICKKKLLLKTIKVCKKNNMSIVTMYIIQYKKNYDVSSNSTLCSEKNVLSTYDLLIYM